MDKHTAFAALALIFAALALIVGVASLIYSIVKNRKSKAIWKELEHKREIGDEAWIEMQIQRWRDGKLSAKREKLSVGKGDVYVIEPLPGWRIVVGTHGVGKTRESQSTFSKIST